MVLQDYFNQNSKIAVAFSGGVDSSYLLFAAKTAGCDVRAYYINSQFQPRFELEDAKRLADSIRAPLSIITMDILCDPYIAINNPDRCYYCKSTIMSKIRELAFADGFETVCDGTNADDAEKDRPGMRALRKYEIASPLRECGLTKETIRILSKQAGLFTHDKPAYACLATRVPTGTEITEEILGKIEKAEETLSDMGFADFRVRFLPPDGAKLQCTPADWDDAAARRAALKEALTPLFDVITLDLKERT